MSDCLLCCDAKQEFSFACCSYSVCLECKAKIEPQGKCPACRTWDRGKSEETNNGASWWYYEGLFDHFESGEENASDDDFRDFLVDSEEDPGDPYFRQPSNSFSSLYHLLLAGSLFFYPLFLYITTIGKLAMILNEQVAQID